jgi:two-component system NtrC family sensor kinase
LRNLSTKSLALRMVGLLRVPKMQSAPHAAIWLLRLTLVASLVLPTALFALASWVNYRTVHAVADERIERTHDVLHEHALKVFETVERSIAEVEEVLGATSDADVKSAERRLNLRFNQIVDALPQVQSVWVIDRNGKPLVSSAIFPLSPALDFSQLDFFRPHISADIGTHVDDVLAEPLSSTGRPVFTLSRRRATASGAFAGVIVIAVLPTHFEDFYARMARSHGGLFAIMHSDGSFLARYPVMKDRSRSPGPRTTFQQAIAKAPETGLYTVVSQIDNTERRTGYRKLAGFPIYVLAAVETAAIENEWRSIMAGHLVFGVPVTLLLAGIIVVALERTRRMYAEAERREAAEGALRQAQRLEAIGQLTGGVAHDFNNLLMIVNGSVQRLRRGLSKEDQTRFLDMITTATQRGESLTRQLLSFSRRQTLTPTVIDLTRLLPEVKDMLHRSLRGDIEIKVDVPSGPCAVRVDPSELELAILNLAVNARDAMPNGGTLTLRVKPVKLKGEAVEEGLQGDFVAVRVSDTGTGIPPEALPHVFEPFFTTKEAGKGTGLGLSQVYGFAKQSGGTATASSTFGGGATITLYLPRSYDVPQPAKAEVRDEAQSRGAGRVLVVEDSPEVAEVCSAYLEQLGYTIASVSSGQAALDFLERKGHVDLVFSDILMPGGLNGVELARIIRERYPHLPVLLSTGYSDSAQEAVSQGFVVLQKPYNIATLRKSLQEAGAVPVSASSLAPSAEPQQEPMGRRAKVLSASDEGGR